MTAERTYLDYNATAPVRPEARAAVTEALARSGNASSVHHEGRAARALIDGARDEVARLANAGAEEVIFTSGGTEASHLALRGLARQLGEQVARIVISAIEHPAVIEAAREAARAAGIAVEVVPVGGDGVVRLDALERNLRQDGRALVSVMLANNETGAIQPVREIADMVHAADGLVHCDAVQAMGKIGVDFKALGLDVMSMTAHKFGGPQGTGALIARDGLELQPLMTGGGQEMRRRSGTENLAGIAGFGAAAASARADLAGGPLCTGLRDRLEAALARLDGGIEIFAKDAPRLPNTSCFALSGWTAEKLLIALDLKGFAVSSGAACSSGKVAASPVLQAMGVEARVAGGAIRVSTGWASTADEIDRFIAGVKEIVVKARVAA